VWCTVRAKKIGIRNSLLKVALEKFLAKCVQVLLISKNMVTHLKLVIFIITINYLSSNLIV